jgi:cell division protease FtsH
LDKKLHINFWYIVIAVLGFMLFQQWWYERQAVETVPYSEFLTMLDAGEIANIQISDRNIRGKLKGTSPSGAKHQYSSC